LKETGWIREQMGLDELLTIWQSNPTAVNLKLPQRQPRNLLKKRSYLNDGSQSFLDRLDSQRAAVSGLLLDIVILGSKEKTGVLYARFRYGLQETIVVVLG
jgi:hypothetical protein